MINVGDQLGDVTGVVGYSFGNFEVNVTETFEITPSGITQETTELAGTDNQLTIASYNVLNLDPNDGDGSQDIDNGQFELLANQIVNNLQSPDIIALQEIQDNSGTANDGILDADLTLQTLVDAIAELSGLVYEFRTLNPPEDGAFGGQPGGNIRNAFLFNPERVAIDESSLTLLSPDELSAAGISDTDAFSDSRTPLVAEFSFNGQSVKVINNHFSSRFGSTPVFGGPQPFIQAGDAAREAQAQVLNDYVDFLIAGQPDANIVVAGDLNTFQFDDRLAKVLPGTGDEQVLTNLVTTKLTEDDAYTFIFDGNSQVLDHVFVTNSLLDGAELDIVHVNNDFARDDNRAQIDDTVVASDHEPVVARLTIPQNFTLQLLHVSDLEGGVDAISRAANFAAITDKLEDQFSNTLILSGGDNFLPGPFFNAAGDRTIFRDSGLFNDVYNDLFDLPGDGTEQYGGLREGGGRVDISIMNIIGFDASAIGNHEFDLGSDAFESIIEEDFRGEGLGDDRWVGAQFPYLSANLDFSGDGDLGNLFTDEILPNTAFQTGPAQSLAGESSTPKIAPSTIIETNGEQIGVIGATTQILQTIASPTGTEVIGPEVEDMEALAAVLQPEIDRLRDLGINKIVLVSHLQQIAFEEELATLLDGVDIIVAGGSDTLLADDNDILRPGDEADNGYPLVTSDVNGNPVLIVSTDGEYSYVGRLVVEFDVDGNVIIDSIDPDISGAVATLDEVVTELYGTATVEEAIAESEKATLVKTLTDAVESVVTEQDANVFGLSNVFLDGRRESVRTEETNLGNLTADANLAVAKAFDASVQVSLKNGGGIRSIIGEIDADGNELPTQENPLSGKAEGEISQLDITNALRFNNSLTLLTLTAAELRDVLEHSVAATESGATPGQFPQVSGISFSFDSTRQAIAFDEAGNRTTAGERIRSLAIVDDEGEIVDILVENGQVVGNANREIRIVTLNFLAGGGDSYPFPQFGADRIDLPDVLTESGLADFADPGTEQDALAEYLASNFPADDDSNTPIFNQAEADPAVDTRIQNLEFRSDDVLEGVVMGTNGNNTIRGTNGENRIFSSGGNDNVDARGGDDYINAGSGNDNVAGGLGDDEIRGEDGNDVLRGDLNSRRPQNGIGGNDTIFGGAGDDRIGGKGGDDQLFGESGDDQIWGDDGDDLLRGGLGDDTLTGDDFSGGQGSDTFVLAIGEGTDTIVDFETGTDFIGLADGLSFGQLTLTQSGGNALISAEEETLAVLNGVTASSLSESDFVTV